MIVEVLLVGILTLIAYWYHTWFQFNEATKNIPYVTPLPLIGNVLTYRNKDEFLNIQMNFVKTLGPLTKGIFGFKPLIGTCDYKLFEFIFRSTEVIDKNFGYDFLHSWLGLGLLTSSGERWKSKRKMITPSYHFNILEDFIGTFEANSRILVEQLRKKVGAGTTDIYPYINLCALDIICETAMGSSVNAQINKDSDYVKSVSNMCRIAIDRAFSPVQQFALLYPLSKNYWTEQKSLKILHDYTISVIKNRRESLRNEATAVEKVDEFRPKKKTAFLDLLLKTSIDGKALSDDEIREEVDTFMFEGHDTTTSAISFALFAIAKHPDVQAEILREQKDIFRDDPNRPVTMKDLQAMTYLELAIKETLRMYPSVPLIGRQVKKDIKYNDELVLKAGWQLNLFIYGIHHDPKYFPEPEKFDPLRFAPGMQNKDNAYSYVPFSAGPRNCIGQKFAMLEMKSVISKVVRNFELLPLVPEHKLLLNSEIILKSRNGVLIKLQDRTWQ